MTTDLYADDRSRHAGDSIVRTRLGIEITAIWRAAFLVAYGVLHDKDAAGDALHDALCRALANASKFDWSRPVKPWFLRIVRNTALNELKRRSRFCELPDIVQPDSVADGVLQSERRGEVRAAIAGLAPKYREVVHLRYVRDLDYSRISSELCVPMGTAKTLLHRAHRAIRCRLSA